MQKLGNVSATDLVIGDLEKDATVRIKPDGTVVLGGEAGALMAAVAPLVEAAIRAAITGHTHVVNTTGTAAAQSGTSLGGTLTGAIPSTAAKKVKVR